jgi:hypothetical protein
MPRTEPMVTPDYEVALSFAGEDREYVEGVALYLKNRGVRIFYDRYEQADLWGKNLYDHLNEVYRSKSRYVVIFISRFYAHKLWTNHERVSAQARAFEEKREYILPVRFDDTEIPGILPTIGYIDLSAVSPEQLGRIIEKKIGRDDFWEREAARALAFTGNHLFNVHRGAIKWMEGVTAVFENRHEAHDKYVKKLRNSINPDLILAEALCEDDSPLVLLVNEITTKDLFNLVWDVFEKSFPQSNGLRQYVGRQKGIAHTHCLQMAESGAEE